MREATHLQGGRQRIPDGCTLSDRSKCLRLCIFLQLAWPQRLEALLERCPGRWDLKSDGSWGCPAGHESPCSGPCIEDSLQPVAGQGDDCHLHSTDAGGLREEKMYHDHCLYPNSWSYLLSYVCTDGTGTSAPAQQLWPLGWPHPPLALQ